MCVTHSQFRISIDVQCPCPNEPMTGMIGSFQEIGRSVHNIVNLIDGILISQTLGLKRLGALVICTSKSGFTQLLSGRAEGFQSSVNHSDCMLESVVSGGPDMIALIKRQEG